jgi:hypothetical protein
MWLPESCRKAGGGQFLIYGPIPVSGDTMKFHRVVIFEKPDPVSESFLNSMYY